MSCIVCLHRRESSHADKMATRSSYSGAESPHPQLDRVSERCITLGRCILKQSATSPVVCALLAECPACCCLHVYMQSRCQICGMQHTPSKVKLYQTEGLPWLAHEQVSSACLQYMLTVYCLNALAYGGCRGLQLGLHGCHQLANTVLLCRRRQARLTRISSTMDLRATEESSIPLLIDMGTHQLDHTKGSTSPYMLPAMAG